MIGCRKYSRHWIIQQYNPRRTLLMTLLAQPAWGRGATRFHVVEMAIGLKKEDLWRRALMQTNVVPLARRGEGWEDF
jgi:hypothetical protein